MIAVIAAILMLMLLLLTLLVRQCSITGRLLVAMIFNYRCTGNMLLVLYDFIVSKRMQLLSRHHSTRINSIRNEYRQQQKYKTA